MGVLLWILLVPLTGFLSISIASMFGPLWYVLMAAMIIGLYKLYRDRPREAFDDRRFLTAEEVKKVVIQIFAKSESED